MDDDIYICDCCGYPIIFRYGDAHQPFHLGTGWPCWEMRQRGECGPPLNFDFPGETPNRLKQQLFKEAKKLCEAYFRTQNVEPVIRFIQKNVFKRGDIIRSLFGYLADKDTKSANELIRRIVISDPWQYFFLKLKREAAGKD